jgi:tRNA pseudouridine38-40 synthase
MPTYSLLIEYDGSAFRGWQAQARGPTVQQTIEDGLTTVLRVATRITGAGRTDAGVHARGQVAHFQSETTLDTRRLRRALEGVLPPTIAIREALVERDDFHARYDAVRRAYRYQVATEARALDRHVRWRLHPAPDFDRMNSAAALLCGEHDFSAFCIARSATRNRTCRVGRAVWTSENRPGDWVFTIEADRFLHGMVRAIVGTLVAVGRGRREVASIVEVLASRDRRLAGSAAPAHGLILERVDYHRSAEPRTLHHPETRHPSDG